MVMNVKIENNKQYIRRFQYGMKDSTYIVVLTHAFDLVGKYSNTF